MKKNIFALSVLIAVTGAVSGQTTASENADSTGLPGDHFSLEGALSLFRDCSSPYEFEKRINNASDNINNLDLNGDGKVDYLSIVTEKVGDNNLVIIKALVGEKETQDVGVIEIEKTGDQQAVAQIVGDKDLYGEEQIVEAFDQAEPVDGGGKGHGPFVGDSKRPQIVVVNVWYWPCVTWFYGPDFVVYVSPWYWGYYPDWWSPWPPFGWYHFHAGCLPYHHQFHHTHFRRTEHAHAIYAPRRVYSNQVVNRYSNQLQQHRTSPRSEPRPTVPANRPQPRPAPSPKPSVRPRSQEKPRQQQSPVRPSRPSPTPRVGPQKGGRNR